MSKYERLTHYLDEQCTMLVIPQRKDRIEKYIERLCELEEKIENGTLVDLSLCAFDKMENKQTAIK